MRARQRVEKAPDRVQLTRGELCDCLPELLRLPLVVRREVPGQPGLDERDHDLTSVVAIPFPPSVAGSNAVTEILLNLGPQRLAGIYDDVHCCGWKGVGPEPLVGFGPVLGTTGRHTRAVSEQPTVAWRHNQRMSDRYEIRPVGTVESPLLDRAGAPLQAHEGAPPAWLVFDDAVSDALSDVAVGDDLVLLTWLDRADRSVLVVRPRDDPRNPLTGVFSTRSPDRPNPIGLHRVTVTGRERNRVRVGSLEAFNGTPIIDVKVVLGPTDR